jgi:hypothetical protein
VCLVTTGSDQSQEIPRLLRSMNMFVRRKLALLNLITKKLRIAHSAKRVNNNWGVNPDIPGQFLSANRVILHERSGRWAILDPEKSEIGTKLWVCSASEINCGGARTVNAPIENYFWTIFKRFHVPYLPILSPCPIQGQRQVNRNNPPRVEIFQCDAGTRQPLMREV